MTLFLAFLFATKLYDYFFIYVILSTSLFEHVLEYISGNGEQMGNVWATAKRKTAKHLAASVEATV